MSEYNEVMANDPRTTDSTPKIFIKLIELCELTADELERFGEWPVRWVSQEEFRKEFPSE